MKKILFRLTIGFISISVPGSFALAQDIDGLVAFNQNKNFKRSIVNLAALESPLFMGDLATLESLPLMGDYVPEAKNINSKAIKDFQERYNNVKNAMWFSDQNSIVSYFVQGGFGNRAFYTKEGRWLYSVILHTEYEIPSDIRASIKSTYFDFAITLVEEVQTHYGVVYVVNLEDKSNIKVLKVSDVGEINILLEITK